MAKRKICVVTGTRAEYGILYPLLKGLQRSASIDLQLLVTGAHVSPSHGNTFREIENDGFVITKIVDLHLGGDSAVDCVKSTGKALIGFADAFAEMAPDLVIVLGDRYEIHAAATSCTLLSIPVCHIAGGEITEGAFDDALRHSISKMASLHFTGHENYSQRVLQMGAEPTSVIKTGSLAIDNILNEPLFSKEELEEQYSFKLNDDLLILTYHPETRALDTQLIALEEIVLALEARKNIFVIVTEPNADPGSIAIKDRLHSFAQSNANRVKIFPSLGRKRFLSTLRFAKGVIGNSSSGLSEAPAFGIGTINIGNRQKGRLMPPSIITVNPLKSDILGAIDRVMSRNFKNETVGSESFFGDGQATKRMIDILSSPDLHVRLSTKFHDFSHAVAPAK
jgi:GDP/UDP-N,N'-diacetylbacillosamine 2-epimerase (hydrolysing)